MTDPAQNPQALAHRILSILKPLSTPVSETHDSARTVEHVYRQLRDLKPPPHLLAATINSFAKLDAASSPPSQTQSPRVDRPLRRLFSKLTTSLIFPKDILYTALDSDVAALLIPAENWRSDHLRTRTRMWHTQTRFNLFREESEGYAKALLHLWECTLSSAEPSKAFETLIAFIGQFSLDTNRVIEVVLSVTAERVLDGITKTGGRPVVHRIPQPFAFILDQFPRNHVCTVIGAMLRTYHDSVITDPELGVEPHPTETDSKLEAKASQSLVSLVSVMVSEGKLQVSDVLGYLSPIDNAEFTTRFVHYENEVSALAEVVNGSRMSAHRTGDDLKNARSSHGVGDRDVFLQYKLMEKATLNSFHSHSQKISFILTLIGLCRSRDAVTAILGLSVNGEHIDVAACPTITKAFIGIIEALLSPLLHSQFPSLYAENRTLTDAIRQLGGKEKGYDVPVETMEDFLSDDNDGPGVVVRQLLMILGPNSRASIRLLQALCRMFEGRKHKYVVSIMKEVVLPAAALVQSNVALADDIWNVLKNWTHPTRWSLYGHIVAVISATNAEYQVVSNRASYETRYVLKRLTADNQKQHTLTLAKITHGQAIAAFSAALDRIQGYPADAVTISPVIEACRRCTSLSIDMLLYLVLHRMADSRRSRLKEDGINTAQWYATLSLFLGLCLRKLSVEAQHIDAVLYFLHSKLVEDDEPLMIAALSDTIKCVADMEVDINLSAKQIQSFGGGPVLREVVNGPWSKLQPDPQMCGTASDVRAEKERSSATCMLLEAFERTEVHAYLAVAIARLTRDAVYHETIRTMPLKLGGNIVDMARTSLLQLSQFMNTSVGDSKRNKECRERIWMKLRNVGLGRMVREMGVPVSSAIALVAPNLDCVKELGVDLQKVSKCGSQTKETSNNTKPSSPNASEELTEKIEITDEVDDLKKLEQSQIHLAEFIHGRVRGCISNSLLTFFWYSKLNDISVPEDIYEAEQKRLLAIKTVWEKEIEASRLHPHVDTDRLRRINLELGRLQGYLENLEVERKALASRLVSVMDTLSQRKDGLVSGLNKASVHERKEATYFFLQECILPRCKLTRPDALFCSRFVQVMLKLDIPAICFAEYYEILLQLAPTIIRSCSENESLCFAYLIKETLLTLESWRNNRSMFQTQAATRNAFRVFVSPDKIVPMKHWQYCQWLYGIHENLMNGLSSVLSSDEYLYSRNSLSLLNSVAEVFPKVSEHCSKIEMWVAKLTRSDLADIRLTSTGVLARLRAGKAKRLPRHIFMLQPVSLGSSSQNGIPFGINASSPAVRKRNPDDRYSGTRPSAGESARDVSENRSNAKEANTVRRSSTKLSVHEQAGKEGTLSGDQSIPKQPSPGVGSSSNGVTAPSISLGVQKEEGRRPLNPNAREFVPAKRETTSTQPGKRSRPSDGGSSSDSVRETGSNVTHSNTGHPSKDMPPPLKRARGEINQMQGDRHSNMLVGEKSESRLQKDRGHDRSSTDEAGKPDHGKPQQMQALPSQHSLQKLSCVSDRAGIAPAPEPSTKQNDERFKISASVGGLKNGGAGRIPSGGRTNSPGRRSTGFRQTFENGQEYGHNKIGTGDRYRDGARGRNVRRDTTPGNVSHGREPMRDTSARDHGSGRRREGYEHNSSGDRRVSALAGDFRRSASESKLGESSGGNDFMHTRDYNGDGHGTKRRREGTSARGPYGYESEGRRQPRLRNDGDYDRLHEEGKIGPDRRFVNSSPGRESGTTSNPNWMDGRRHGDLHENARRQSEDDHIGWQKRGERDFESGPRGMRRDDRDMYYDRQERYGEGPVRRDDRRRPLRRGAARRRTGRG